MKICVIGSGYVGLVVGACLAETGNDVCCADIDSRKIDALKKSAGLNKALDAEVVYKVDDDELRRKLQAYAPDLEDIVGAGCHSFAEKNADTPAVTVEVIDRRQAYQACARSWKRRPDVGTDAEFPDLSARDAAAVRARR